jgi:hypothetical protein
MTVKTFDDYLNEVEKKYNFRIKTVSPLTGLELAKIENSLRKYSIKYVSPIRRTIIQDHPLDFQDVINTEVYIVDITTGYPASSYILQQELRLALNIPEKFIVVRGENEPMETETARLQTLSATARKAEKDNLSPAATLSTNSHDYDAGPRADELFGDKYNGLFLQYLADVRRDRQLKIDAPKPLFTNIEMPEMPVGGDDFNAGYDTVKPVSKAKTTIDKADKPMANMRSNVGNFDDDTRKYLRYYQDENGKRVGLERAADPIRKGKNNG